MTGAVRSLNLATAVGIVLYEALRQTGSRSRSRWPSIEQPVTHCRDAISAA